VAASEEPLLMSSLIRISDVPQLPSRAVDSHKGSYGRVVLIGGSVGMSGAISLAGLGALRGGAGLVYLACPRSIWSVVAAIEPSYLTVPLPEDAQGRLSIPSVPEIMAACQHTDAVAIGPGLGQSDELHEVVAQVIRSVNVPCVVDADALNLLADQLEMLSTTPSMRVLTPHPGEFARLTGLTIQMVQANREALAVQFAKRYRVIVVLKGAGTVITDGERLCINQTGNPGMATGGTGDVLTGLITSLLAQGADPFDAACLGCHLHGLAGDIAAEELSLPGLIASDLPKYLPLAWKRSSNHQQ
jgi:ADP-dependent NAD(P)H-hydrate dehydratase